MQIMRFFKSKNLDILRIVIGRLSVWLLSLGGIIFAASRVLKHSEKDINEEKELTENQIHYQAIINLQTDLLYRYSSDGKITFANRAFCQFFGIKADKVFGKNRLEYIPPEVHETVLNLTASLNAEQPSLINENNNIDCQGQPHWFHWTNQAIFNDAGEIIEYLSVARDITERKKLERKHETLINALEHRSVLLESASIVSKSAISILSPDDLLKETVNLILKRFNYYYVGIFLVDDEKNYALLKAATGEAGKKMLDTGHKLKINENSMIGWSVLHTKARITLDVGKEATHFNNPLLPETRSEMALPLVIHSVAIGSLTVQSAKEAAFTEEDIAVLQIMADQLAIAIQNARLYKQAQDEIKLRTQAEAQLQDTNLALEERVNQRTLELNRRVGLVENLNAGMINLLNDLNAANAIAKTNAENLKQANAELESFSHSVSHDLRAPLRHIEKFSAILDTYLEDKHDDKSRHYMKNITKSALRMRSLIEDLLALSSTSRADLHIKPLDLNLIIDSVRAQLLDEVNEREITWKIAPLPPIQADAGLIKILWENLIGNAVKYTRPRAKTIIEIGTVPSDKIPIFFIRDNGVGFSPEYYEQLFTVFQRLHKAEEFEGSGIGLATVKRIIERHQGKIWAEGEPDKGATFYFSLENDK